MDTVFDEKDFESFTKELKAAPQQKVDKNFTRNVMLEVASFERRRKLKTWFAIAAGLSIFCALSSMYRASSFEGVSEVASKQLSDGYFTNNSSAQYIQAFAVKALAEGEKNSPAFEKAVSALADTQNAEGGWNGAALSARNVLALSLAASRGIKEAQVAYRKGLKYLRKQGIVEMTLDEFTSQAREAAIRLYASGDAQSARIVAIAAK
jgi:hypothetical protein